MKQTSFIRQREADWLILEHLLSPPSQPKAVKKEQSARNKSQTEHTEALSSSESATQTDISKNDIDLPRLYRAVAHDLAIAKSRHYSPAIIMRLNQILLAGQAELYQPKRRVFYQLARFLRATFPSAVQQLKHHVIINHVLFYGLALVAFLLTIFDHEFIYQVMSKTDVYQMEQMYNPASEHFAKERPSDSDFQMFGYYIYNNIKIAFQTFVGGLLLGVGALFFLIFNGFYFGAVSGHMINLDYQSTFFSFVITHGAFELTAIVLSAAAGTNIGWRLLRPGVHSRLYAVQLAANQSFPLMFGSFLFLVLAAFIEAFWSSSQTVPIVVKFIVGGICWLWVAGYLMRKVKIAAR